MKMSYIAPLLYCEEFVADTMIASCNPGDPCQAVDGSSTAMWDACLNEDSGYQYGTATGLDPDYPTNPGFKLCWI